MLNDKLDKTTDPDVTSGAPSPSTPIASQMTVLNAENYFNKYLAFRVQISNTNFKSSKSMMISFKEMTDQKANQRLFSIHLKMLSSFLTGN